MKAAVVGVFTPWKCANTIHQGFQLPALLPLHSKIFDLKMQLIHFNLFVSSSVNFGKCREFVYSSRSKYRMYIITLQILLFLCSQPFPHPSPYQPLICPLFFWCCLSQNGMSLKLYIFFHLAKWTWDVPTLLYESMSCSYLTPSSISLYRYILVCLSVHLLNLPSPLSAPSCLTDIMAGATAAILSPWDKQRQR